MSDLEQLVRSAAAGPTRGVDPDALWRAARRHVWVQRVAVILIVAGLGTGAFWFLDASPGVIIGDDAGVEPAGGPEVDVEVPEPYGLPLYRTIAVRAISSFTFEGATATNQEELRALWDEIDVEGPPPALRGAGAAVVADESNGCAVGDDITAVSLRSDEILVHLSPVARGSQASCDSIAERVVYVVALPAAVTEDRSARFTAAEPPADATPVPLPIVDEEQLRRTAITWMRAIAEGDEQQAVELSDPSTPVSLVTSMTARTSGWREEVGITQGQPVVGRVLPPADSFVMVCVGLRQGSERFEGGLLMRASAVTNAWRPSEYRGSVGCLGDDGQYGAFGTYEARMNPAAAVFAVLLGGVGGLLLVGDRQARRWAATHPGRRRQRQDPGRDYMYTQNWKY